MTTNAGNMQYLFLFLQNFSKRIGVLGEGVTEKKVEKGDGTFGIRSAITRNGI